MIYKKSGPPDTPLAPVTYEFLAPTRVTMRYPDGQELLIGYGISEQITVLELSTQYLVYSQENLSGRIAIVLMQGQMEAEAFQYEHPCQHPAVQGFGQAGFPRAYHDFVVRGWWRSAWQTG
jgi:hypothetical protein